MNATSQKLAHWFITKSREESKPLTPVKLTRLVVIAYYEYLYRYNAPLMNESLEAWESGPVVVSLYHEYKDKGINEPIENPSRRQTPLEPEAELEAFLNDIWKGFAKYTGRQLDRATRLPGSPWARTLIKNQNVPHPAITDETIMEYFQSL